MFTLPTNVYYFRIWFNSSLNPITCINSIQIEQGTQATSYEPFKSNILSTLDDVVLRGIEDVKDELDCLTGKVTERIGEIVLDGSESWWHYINVETMKNTFCLADETVSNVSSDGIFVSNSYVNYQWFDIVDKNLDKTIGNAYNSAI